MVPLEVNVWTFVALSAKRFSSKLLEKADGSLPDVADKGR